MGSGQRFRLPNALKRTKSSARQDWQPEGNEYKVQHVLGINETDFNTARNQSISSSVTAKLPTLSFSDATTEFGSSSYPPTEPPHAGRDLNVKASSVLLHEDFLLKADVAPSVRSKPLKKEGSSSTLNSFYDAQRTPLAISQQTSDSSRRDFALRKGAPVVVKPTAQDKDLFRQLKVFRLSKIGDKNTTKRLTKANPDFLDPGGKMGNPQFSGSPERSVRSGSSHQLHQSNSKKGVHFNPNRSSPTLSPPRSKSSAVVPPRLQEPQVKVNIRRPKAGAKYWFDGLEGDSTSDEESIHEPELQPSFVAGLEEAFQGGRIGTVANDEQRSQPRSSESRIRSSNYMLPPSAIPPRIATLNAKSSKSTLSHKSQKASSYKGSHVSSLKTKVGSLASTDLHQTSVLDLSSSDDDEPSAHGRMSADASLPLIRDSIAVDALIESEIELGTAKAIVTNQNTSVQATPSLRRVRGARTGHDGKARSRPKSLVAQPNRQSTYLSDLSSPTMEEEDLLTSFPLTPTTDQTSSNRPPSDAVSIESRRLMSVTRQEESLLAAIRSKKALIAPPHATGTDLRIRALRNVDKKPPIRKSHDPRSSSAFEIQLALQGRMPQRVLSPSDPNFDQASCTTIQTGPSIEPSVRYSVASFLTGTSVDPETDTCPSLPAASPPFRPPANAAVNRMSRSTFFSTSTNSSRDDSRNRKESHYLATLEKLQATPKREDVSSQDFIDWPYNGWMKLATAH